MKCLFCQTDVLETDLVEHIRTDHNINHDKAVEMLIGLQYSEQVTNTTEHVTDTQQNEVIQASDEDQQPVNEQSESISMSNGYVTCYHFLKLFTTVISYLGFPPQRMVF